MLSADTAERASVKGVWHTGLTVANLERALAFYTELLGMKLVHQQVQNNAYTQRLVGYTDASLRVAMLTIPGAPVGPSGHVLELIEYVAPPGKAQQLEVKDPGTAHVSFVVEDIHATYERLRAAGVHFRSAPVAIEEGRNIGGFACYLTDPDGVTLELVQPPTRLG